MTVRPNEAISFPENLGVFAADAVMRGEQPVRYVAHTPDDDWWISDRLTGNDPDLFHVVHLSHLLELDSSIEALASLPAGEEAERDGVDEPWRIGPFAWADE